MSTSKKQLTPSSKAAGKWLTLIGLMVFAGGMILWYYLFWVASQPKLSDAEKDTATQAISELRQTRIAESPLNNLMMVRVRSVTTITNTEAQMHCDTQSRPNGSARYYAIKLDYFVPEDGIKLQTYTFYSCNLTTPSNIR